MNTKTLLIVEDDLFTSRLIKTFFERKGFIVHQAYDTGGAYMYATEKRPDLIILDIQLPSDSGVSIFNTLKNIHPCPIVFYTSISTENMEIKAIEIGGDDYVNKQRGMKVLHSRVVRLIEKSATKDTEALTPLIEINNIRLNSELNQCQIGDMLIELQKKESTLLSFLMLHKNTLVNRDELSFILNGYSHDGWSRSIDLIVCRIRKKLRQANIPESAIKTLRGKGYSLVESNFKAA
ncbi:response regulator with CheY-like receiver domain and winged-helix DNA-binding domain [Shewanella psychrophila]|uniref:Response regulator with CheY-like receiver domain and winged-helix DNA-binding domain n=1 Tax=Shewanella psychrophila TaxID=225848 RepID=A0A1S6HU50_9GAMM|nr:response regulator transcription factor [Shewanella psychrophila]AQS39086.1 response regulator with CheY-like receiver domain and winged-helix DNA-binding domain [Shewanella psychrophila]